MPQLSATPTFAALPRRLAQPLRRPAPPAARSSAAASARRGSLQERPLRRRPTPPVGDRCRAIAAGGHRRADRPRPDPRLRLFPGGAARPLRAARRARHRRHADRAACATSWSTPPFPAPRLIVTASPPYWPPTERRAERPRAPWAFPSPAATATRTAPEAIWPPRWRSSPRRRKWTRPSRMQRNG